MEKMVSLVFQEFGEGIPVVFLHGFALNHTIWNPVVPLLRSEARLILPDLRGHGRSESSDGPYSMDLMAKDVKCMLEKLEIEKAVLVGHSMGGYIAQAFARYYPERLAGLGFVATRFTPDTSEKIQARFKTIRSVEKHGAEVIAEDMADKLTTRLDLVPSLYNMIKKTPQAGLIGGLKGMAQRIDSTDLVRGLRIPWVFVAGVKDAFVPVEEARAMTAGLASDRYFEAAEAGHMPMLESPEVVADALKLLLRLVENRD